MLVVMVRVGQYVLGLEFFGWSTHWTVLGLQGIRICSTEGGATAHGIFVPMARWWFYLGRSSRGGSAASGVTVATVAVSSGAGAGGVVGAPSNAGAVAVAAPGAGTGVVASSAATGVVASSASIGAASSDVAGVVVAWAASATVGTKTRGRGLVTRRR